MSAPANLETKPIELTALYQALAEGRATPEEKALFKSTIAALRPEELASVSFGAAVKTDEFFEKALSALEDDTETIGKMVAAKWGQKKAVAIQIFDTRLSFATDLFKKIKDSVRRMKDKFSALPKRLEEEVSTGLQFFKELRNSFLAASAIKVEILHKFQEIDDLLAGKDFSNLDNLSLLSLEDGAKALSAAIDLQTGAARDIAQFGTGKTSFLALSGKLKDFQKNVADFESVQRRVETQSKELEETILQIESAQKELLDRKLGDLLVQVSARIEEKKKTVATPPAPAATPEEGVVASTLQDASFLASLIKKLAFWK